jgi:ribose/xylose/arabinose/galactoside ABC-type transport system permease subunit
MRRSISGSKLFWNARPSLAWILAGLAFVYFALTNSDFLNTGNLYALMQIYSTLALVAAGLAIVMIAAEFDLSIAGVFPLAALVTVKVADSQGVFLAVVAAVAIGVAVGLVNGYMTGGRRIPSLAVTVATMVLTVGLGYLVANGELVSLQDFKISLRVTEPILGIFSIMSFVQLGLALLAAIYLKVSWRGRFLFAVGSDAGRARASGLPVTATVIVAFVICAVFAAVAGSIQGLALGTGQSGAEEQFLLQVATAALVGGVALTGGRGSLAGVFGGALLLSLLSNGLGLAGVDAPIIELIDGCVLIFVVVVDRPLNRLIDRRLKAELAQGVPTR